MKKFILLLLLVVSFVQKADAQEKFIVTENLVIILEKILSTDSLHTFSISVTNKSTKSICIYRAREQNFYKDRIRQDFIGLGWYAYAHPYQPGISKEEMDNICLQCIKPQEEIVQLGVVEIRYKLIFYMDYLITDLEQSIDVGNEIIIDTKVYKRNKKMIEVSF